MNNLETAFAIFACLGILLIFGILLFDKVAKTERRK